MTTSQETALSIYDFQIIWLDNNIGSIAQSDSINRKLDFHHLIDHLKTYSDLSQCQQYIVSLDQADKIFLIVSGTVGEEILPSIHDCVQIACIYIFCIDIFKHQEWAKKFNKIRGIFNESEAMLKHLQRDIQLLLHHFTPVNIFAMRTLKETTLQNIDKEQATYMWFQLLMEALLRLPHTPQAYDEFIRECTERYKNNGVEKKKIEQFSTQYRKDNVIQWYTRDCFLYRLINRALRTRNIDNIFKYRYIIVDLHQELVELHRKQYSTESSIQLTVYRGQLISVEELSKLRENRGGVFSVNAFFSATSHSDVAIDFITDVFAKPFLERVIYEINIVGPGPWKWPFADIHGLSCNNHEGEILFDIGSTFRIDDVYEYTNDLWYVSLSLININDPLSGVDTKLYDYLLDKTFEKDEPLFVLCNFLEQMGEFERSKEFCHLLLCDLPEGHELIAVQNHLALIEYELGHIHAAESICEQTLAIHSELDKRNGEKTISKPLSHLHSNFGMILSELGKYKEAIYHYLQAVSMDEVLLDKDHVDLAVSFNNIGLEFQDLGDIKEALYWLEERALKLQLLKLPSNHPDLATTYSNIGVVHCENGNYRKARENHERALAIEKIALSPLHPSMAVTYNNLGVLCEKMGDYDAALGYHRQALEVLLHSHTLDHFHFACTYNNMAAVFDWQGEFEKAMQHYEKALEYLLASVGTDNHPDVAACYNNIGMILFQKDDYAEAFKYFEKTRKIEECILEKHHPSLATTYNNLGMVYAAQGRFNEAMQYHRAALTIRKRALSKTHPELASSFDNIGVVHYKKGQYKAAIDFHRRALSIQSISLPNSHPSAATTKDHLGDIYFRLKNYRAALKFYTDALNMAQSRLPATHPSIKRYRNKVNHTKEALGKK